MNSCGSRLWFLILSLLCACSTFAQSNIYSLNVVGYINLTLYPGDNLIANQLENDAGGQTNRINSILSNVLSGSTFKVWDSASQTFLPTSTFDGSSWSINYELNLGQGAVFNSPGPVLVTNTFVGSVVPYFDVIPQLGSPVWNPNYANGMHLLSSPIPIGAPMSTMFYYATGRNPQQGESVTLLNPAMQSYLTTTYDSLNGWSNGDPTLAVGQAGWFNLGPVNVPEPAICSLFSVAGLWAMLRRSRT